MIATSLVILVIVLILAYKKLYSPKKKEKIRPFTYSNPQPSPTITNDPVEESVIEKDEYDIFYNHFREGMTDFSDLTPAEAKKEMEEKKEDGEYLSSEDWKGYMDVIASKNDDKFFEKISTMTAEETHEWFMSNLNRDVKMSSAIWEKVHEEVAPIHEDILIEMLKPIKPFRVRSWVANCKHKGFFFTDKMYNLAREKYDQRRKK